MRVSGPYESPIEQIFAETCQPHLAEGVRILPQREVSTAIGLFRLDFLLLVDDYRVGVECDGSEFHLYAKDRNRDMALLLSGEVDTIYRLRGTDLYQFPEDCLWALSIRDPSLFGTRGLAQLSRLRRLDLDLAMSIGEDILLVCQSYSKKRLCPVEDICNHDEPCFVRVGRRSKTD
jgi:hypothetical protein